MQKGLFCIRVAVFQAVCMQKAPFCIRVWESRVVELRCGQEKGYFSAPNNNNTMNYGYIRVSSDHQTVENQRFEIKKYCERQNIQIHGWIEETISGTKNYDKRKLGNLLKKVKKDDLIICAELSRLGRSLFMIMNILNICMNKGCKVWTIKDGYRLGEDIQSKVLAFAFGLSAEIERTLISQRTKEALARKKAEGVKLGRPRGSCVTEHPKTR